MQKFNTLKSLKTMLVLAIFPIAGFAGLITVNFDAGDLYNTTALTGYGTYGDMMDGMLVTAYFTNGLSEAQSWADIAAGAGGVSGTDWSLNVYGDTWNSDWTLTSTGAEIDYLLIEGGPGNTMFDTDYDPTYIDLGTPGSANGYAFGNVRFSGADLDITATYSDLLGVGGAAPVGDLYLNLAIDFNEAFVNNSLRYRADADNSLFSGDINSVPEPASFQLVLLGILMLMGFARKKVVL